MRATGFSVIAVLCYPQQIKFIIIIIIIIIIMVFFISASHEVASPWK